MPDKVKRIYWDSCAFIKCISNLSDNESIKARENCKRYLQDAMDGKVEIYTSAFTITEVRNIESNNVKPIPDDVKQKIVDLWSEPYIKIVPVDIARAEHARELVWQYSWLSNEDAIQIASALYARVDELHTYDGVSKKGMLSLDQKLGNPPLRIVIPQYQGPDRLPGL